MRVRHIRIAFLAIIVIQIGYLGSAYAGEPQHGLTKYQEESRLDHGNRTELVGDRDGVTVMTGQQSPFSRSKALYAFAQNGTLLYYSNSSGLGDVDPSPAGEQTVLHPRHYKYEGSRCDGQKCSLQQIVRTNLSTGKETVVWERMTPGQRASNWHDVDRYKQTDRYAIASIEYDELRVVNTSSGMARTWNAQAEYNVTNHGTWPQDWTHLNDVDWTPVGGGSWMLSLRNHDQVVFVHPERGLLENWTLGCDDCHGILYEQHNPDYIPKAHGGPAIIVADSENDRIVEYQRVDGEWEQSWVWQDETLDWPRDADRLPNGNTLIADSHGNRVIEVNQSGDIVWKAYAPNVYNVERLSTGDGSAGGPSAVRANVSSKTLEDGPVEKSPSKAHVGTFDIWWNKVQFVLPDWMGFLQALMAIELVGVLGVWAWAELYWRGLRFRMPAVWNRNDS